MLSRLSVPDNGSQSRPCKGKPKSEQDAYFRDSLEWLKQRHGAENVVYAGIHRDETTPHMYAYVVPRDPELNASTPNDGLGGQGAAGHANRLRAAGRAAAWPRKGPRRLQIAPYDDSSLLR